MNIQMQCCGIILLLVIMYFYIRQKKLYLSTEKAFFEVCKAMLCCISLDVLSILVIVQMEYLPQLLVTIVCKTYPVSLVSVATSCLAYVCVDVYMDSPKYRRYLKRIACSAVIAYVIIYALPIQYFYNQETQKLYTYGPCIVATYGFSVAALAVNMVIMHKQKHRINPKRREAVFIWMLLWIGAATIQAVVHDVLMVSFAGCVGVMVLYIKLENPETNLERKTGLFNQNAFSLYTQQLYCTNKEFHAIFITFEGTHGNEGCAGMDDEMSLRLVRYLMDIPKSKAFKKAEEEFVLILFDEPSAAEWANKIKDYFVNLEIYPSIFYVPHVERLDKRGDIQKVVRYAHDKYQDTSEGILHIINDEIIAQMYQEKTIMLQIQQAMEMDRVVVFYQPIYSTKDQRFTSAEALVRIQDEDGKIIPPGVFIEVAEKNGMIVRLGEIVFEKVCSFIKQNRIEQYGIEYVEVNLSVVQCADEHLANTYIQIMKRHNVNPNMINLEITESASLNAKKVLLDNMKCLINYGVKFSLDDFGTGQSNLNYIVDMPVDIVKFDRYMTNAYFENKKAKYVMNAAMHMIHGMELEIVSEGIETEKQFEAMKNLGISYIQGYYFSKPLPEEEFLEFLAEA